MSKQVLVVRFPPGIVTIIDRKEGQNRRSFMYVEGVVAFTDQGLVPLSGGFIIEIFPITVGGRPGGQLRLLGIPGSKIQGDVAFAGDFAVEIPGGRVLVVRSVAGGRFDFFLGKTDGLKYQLHPVPFSKIQVQLKLPAHIPHRKPASHAVHRPS